MIQVECSVCHKKVNREEPREINNIKNFYCSKECYYARGGAGNGRSGAYVTTDGRVQRVWSVTLETVLCTEQAAIPRPQESAKAL